MSDGGILAEHGSIPAPVQVPEPLPPPLAVSSLSFVEHEAIVVQCHDASDASAYARHIPDTELRSALIYAWLHGPHGQRLFGTDLLHLGASPNWATWLNRQLASPQPTRRSMDSPPRAPERKRSYSRATEYSSSKRRHVVDRTVEPLAIEPWSHRLALEI